MNKSYRGKVQNMDGDKPKQWNSLFYQIQKHTFILGLISMVWFLLRSGIKPSRASYPCQIVARANSEFWLASYFIPLTSPFQQRLPVFLNRKKTYLIVAVLFIVSAGMTVGLRYFRTSSQGPTIIKETDVGSTLTEWSATLSPTSDIFVVSGTNGNDDGVERLLGLMGSQGLKFYGSQSTGKNQGPEGLIVADDVVVIKVNSQWNERGGTNTDLVKAIIQAILKHPDGFTGEVIVADNGQAQYGSTGHGGSFDYTNNNAEDKTQSIQTVVSSLSGSHRVSTYLWDTITTKMVEEYAEADLRDGYVVNSTINPRTGIMVSYPKFMTSYGTYISFRDGIWDQKTGSYHSDRLKVINVPVLKTHRSYGVTACIKHYMGVPSDKLTAKLGSRTHNTIGQGSMGTLMAETRYPVLNILDAIWVNADPASGPITSYGRATKVNVLAASTDPVALDRWATEEILIEATPRGSDKRTIDPNNDEPSSFGYWLKLSMQELVSSGYQVTLDKNKINVYISR